MSSGFPVTAAGAEVGGEAPSSGVERGLAAGVYREVLPNGVTLLLKRASASPVVAVTTYFKVGYFHERDEESGLAHLMEHMFFKGSESWPGPEDIGRAINGLGGSLNAGTIYDRTFYYFVLPKEALETAIHIMADAVIRPGLDAEEMRKEIEVVIEESNRKRDNPGPMASELMFELAFDAHRMRRWRIGSDQVLRALTRERAVDFHRRLYRPAHLIVSVVGDLHVDQARALIAGAFAPLSVGEPQRVGSPPEPPQQGLKVGHRQAAIQQAYLELGFKTPGVNHPDQEALELLAEILGGGSSSRLHRTVKVEAGLVRTIDAACYAFEDVGMFHISATLDPGRLSDTRQRLFAELERVRRWGVSADELTAARNQLEASRLFQLEEVRGQAVTLAYHEAYGDYREVDRSLARMKALKASDLQRVARQYLDFDRATVFSYLPNGADQPINELEVVGKELESARQAAGARPSRHSNDAASRGRRLPSARASARGELRLRPLPGGGALIVQEDAQLPNLAVGVYFPGGRQHEPADRAGLTRLAVRAARTGGTLTRQPDAFLGAVEALGARIDPEIDAEYFGYRLHLPAARSAAGLELLTDLVSNPVFAPERLDRERETVVADIRQGLDQPNRSAVDLMLSAFYGCDHPLGNPSGGREAVVSTVSRDEVMAWHRGALGRNARLVVAAGDVRADALEAAVVARLAGLPEQAAPVNHTARADLREIVERIEFREKQQTALAFGFAAPAPTDPDYPALQVMIEILAGFGGRLASELRGRKSLAYTVSAYDLGMSRENALVCFIAGEAGKEQASREGILFELRRLREAPVAPEELERAVAMLIGRRATGLQTLSARVSRYASVQLKGVGLEGFAGMPDAYRRVKAEHLQALAERYLCLDRYAIGVARGRGK